MKRPVWNRYADFFHTRVEWNWQAREDKKLRARGRMKVKVLFAIRFARGSIELRFKNRWTSFSQELRHFMDHDQGVNDFKNR